jgi:beta-lactamase class A
MLSLVWLLPPRVPAAQAVLGSDPDLEAVIRSHVPDGVGTFGVAVKDLSTGRTAFVNPDEVFETASLYKLYVMVELYRQDRSGRVSLDREPELRSELESMITVSDNDAAEALWERLGIVNINATMRDMGLPNSQVAFVSTTTPREMSELLERIAMLRAVDAEASAAMLRVMGRQQINDRIPSLLPDGLFIAHKTGDLDTMSHDAGIVYAPSGPFVVVALCKDSYDVYGCRTAEAEFARAAF